jgi:ZIP family zinc transporter
MANCPVWWKRWPLFSERFTVYIARFLLPYALAFAAGAMIFVVVDSLILEWHLHGNRGLAMMGLFMGFASMMVLDVTFG